MIGTIHNTHITDLQDQTLALDFRVTALEENGGGDGNSSVAELEVRVETLEEITADHETRISAVETDVNFCNYFKTVRTVTKMYFLKYIVPSCLFLDLGDDVSDHETRLTAAEENIQGNIALHKN